MKVIVYINFILTLLLIGAFFWLLFFQKQTSTIKEITKSEDKISYVDTCGEECKKEIEKIVSSETVKTVLVTPAPQKEKLKTAYIPIGGPITTTSSAWYDAPGTDFNLDLNGSYGKDAKVTWEAFLKVAHGNGMAYVRLFDVTHGIAVNGSEVSLTDNPNLTQINSSFLSFWAGNNQYRVQIKSLNTFEVTFGSGRVKIVY